MNAIELRGLSHIYHNGRGVRDIDLTVQSGEVFGFLGPNGAGKTTLRRLVGSTATESGPYSSSP